jgi:hypothetical protein
METIPLVLACPGSTRTWTSEVNQDTPNGWRMNKLAIKIRDSASNQMSLALHLERKTLKPSLLRTWRTFAKGGFYPIKSVFVMFYSPAGTDFINSRYSRPNVFLHP